jgi:hypothetical protein
MALSLCARYFCHYTAARQLLHAKETPLIARRLNEKKLSKKGETWYSPSA